jgi:hypothetical protein
MRPNDGAINDDVFHIGVISKMKMHLLPNASVTPTRKALVDAVPLAILRWQLAPLSTGAQYPVDGLKKAPALCLLSGINFRTLLQELINL